MKRFFAFILSLVMMLSALTGCDSAANAPDEFTVLDAEYAVNASDIAVVGEQIYYISDGAVYETGRNEPIFSDFTAQYIASDGNALAVYGSGQIFCGEKTYTISETEITGFVYVGDIFCWSYYEDDLPQIGFYNTKNDNTISIDPLTGIACRLFPYKDTDILVACYEVSGEAYTYEFDTVSMKAGKFALEKAVTAAACPDGDTLAVVLDSERLEIHHSAEGSIEQVQPCDELTGDVKKIDFAGSSAVFLDENGTIYVRKDYYSTLEESNTIVLIAETGNMFFGGYLLEQMNDALSEQYGLELVCKEYSSTDAVQQKQLAGDNDYDLYITSGFDIVLDSPICEPLNDYSAVTDRFNEMYDEIREICTFDGKIYGVLLDLQVQNSLWGYNAELLEELDLSLPDPDWTLDDYYDLAVQLRETGNYIGSFIPLRLADYLHRYGDMYETHSLTDDGTMLRKLLEITKKLKKEGLLYDKETAEPGARTLFGVSSLPFSQTFTPDGETDDFIMHDVWYLVTFDGKIPDLTIMTFLQMNLNSLNKENAALVIAECMKPQYTERISTGVVLYKETGEALRAMSDKAEGNFQIYLNVLQNSRPFYSHDRELMQFFNAEAEKYYNDEQDLDYTVTQIYTKAKTLFAEQP